MKTDEKNPNDWLFLARERLHAADALFQSLGVTFSGVELLQEAVERFLKAYLISKGWELQKIHNLSTLLDHAVAFDERFKAHADLSENLTVQFWAQHYPGDDLSEVGLDYPELRQQAGELIDLINAETNHS
ncbi:MAG: HEPN domain-containing protein [Terrimicrobiaceae bacterium]